MASVMPCSLLGLLGTLAGTVRRQVGDQRARTSDRLFGHRRTVSNREGRRERRLVPSDRWRRRGIDVATDLVAEQQALDDVVAGLSADEWPTPTPSPGWTVADQIGHLTYFDRTARLAIADPDAFADASPATCWPSSATPRRWRQVTLGDYRAMATGELLAAWRRGRAELDRRRPSAAAGCPRRVVRTVDEHALVPDGAADGDVGPRSGRRRRRRRRAAGDRPAASRRPARRDHPRVELPQPRTRRARRATCGVELAAPSGDEWTWGSDGRRRLRDRAGRGLLPRRHAAPPRRRHATRHAPVRSPATGWSAPRPSPDRRPDGPRGERGVPA